MNADDRPSATSASSPGRVLRRIFLWATLAMIVVLIVLSIIAAELGPTRARQLFNSWPLAVLWIALAAGLLAAPVAFAALRAIGPMATHAGLALVLIGSLWGSQAMHEFRAAHLGEKRIWRGIMGTQTGYLHNQVLVYPNIFADPEQAPAQEATLPFALYMDRFWIDLYNPRPDKWLLYTPVRGRDGELHGRTLDWELGEPLFVDPPRRAIAVTHYYPHARVAVRQVAGPSSEPEAASQPAPTTQLELAVEPDVDSPLPAARISMLTEEGIRRFWLIPPRDPAGVVCTPEPEAPAQPIGLVRYDPNNPDEVRSFNAQVQVWRDGKSLGDKCIQVNHPLHYGGYDFYQAHSEWDKYRNDTTTLLVVADSGMAWVYAGFLVGSLGIFWTLWGAKATRALSRLKVHP